MCAYTMCPFFVSVLDRLLLHHRGRHGMIALFMFSRSLHLVWRYLVMTGRLPYIHHADAAAFTVFSAAIMSVFVLSLSLSLVPFFCYLLLLFG